MPNLEMKGPTFSNNFKIKVTTNKKVYTENFILNNYGPTNCDRARTRTVFNILRTFYIH